KKIDLLSPAKLPVFYVFSSSRACSSVTFSSRPAVATVYVGQRGPNMAKLKVLYGELNEETLAAQAESLQKAGYQVQGSAGRKGVQEALSSGAFDLVILGPTLTRDDRHHLPYM